MERTKDYIGDTITEIRFANLNKVVTKKVNELKDKMDYVIDNPFCLTLTLEGRVEFYTNRDISNQEFKEALILICKEVYGSLVPATI